MRQVTLCLLIKTDQVLLAMKKRGFGEGWWNGAGGKVEGDETLEKAAIRETQEEIGVTPTKLKKVAVIDFYFQETDRSKDWNQTMHGYLVTEWQGKPSESEEMRPECFDKNNLPLENMWPADKFWIPLVLDGKLIKGRVNFDPDKKLIDYNFEEMEKLD